MKIISFIPSITETLLAADVEVVGRTRFCVHPKETVKNISVVGGTKDADWEKAKTLQPDLVLFDREENTKEMSTACPLPQYSLHVTSLETLAAELSELGRRLNNSQLAQFSAQQLRLLRSPPEKSKIIPSVKVLRDWNPNSIKTILYLCWRNPWIAVSRETFIGSMLAHLGHELPRFPKKYAEINLEDYSREETLLLFSTEPFPFAAKEAEILALGFPAAIVDGEGFGWFGVRSIRFLENLR